MDDRGDEVRAVDPGKHPMIDLILDDLKVDDAPDLQVH
jgi:hypothetical protein